MYSRALLSLSAALSATVICMSPALAAGEKVGVAAAVNPTATGHLGGQSNQLRIGSDIVHNQRIQTSSEGSTQVIFVDRSTLTISPNADVTIDNFVFNPSSNTGELAVNLGKGLMRFVGGQISHSGGVTVNTPSATLGIRGGIAVVNSANGKTTVVHLYGITKVTNGKNSVTIVKPGFFTEAGGGQVSPPSPAPPGLLASYNARLQSKPGQNGGSPPGQVTSDKVKNGVGLANGNNGTPGANQYQVTYNPNAPQGQPDQPAQPPGQPPGEPPGQPPGGGGGGGPPPPTGGGITGPPWGLSIAPGQTGIHVGPPGQGIAGHKPKP
jgi:hypothetical protein